MKQSAAALGISVLGLSVAGSVAVTGAHSQGQLPAPVSAPQEQLPVIIREPGVVAPAAFARREDPVSRSAARVSLATAALAQLADQPTKTWTAAERRARLVAQAKAVEARSESLASASAATAKRAGQIKAAQLKAARAKARKAAERKAAERRAAVRRAAERRAAVRKAAENKAAARKSAARKDGHASSGASLPITSGYHLAARFGDTGPWSRYHTGLDFSAPMGTTVRAMASGVVTHAGSGRAGWAGRYVTIRHADGKTTLYAHLSTAAVHEGERVSGGERIGSVGMTGRTFGPHVHVELYPRGARPADIYSAINPSPWMRARGIHP